MELYAIDMRDVKSRAGSLRATRAAETRLRIEEAARRCFSERGYAATTLREIAAEAGVAVQTVYATFGSKAAILRSLRGRVVGDTEADAAWAAALEAATVAAAVGAFARSIRLRWEHGADVVAADTDAARTEAAIRAEVEGAIRGRRAGIVRLATSLVGLDPRLGSAERVAATLEALTVTDAYLVLTGANGWTPDEYETWLRRAIADALAAIRSRRAARRPDRTPRGPARPSSRRGTS
jgi:AcrR family transcriptional regulator